MSLLTRWFGEPSRGTGFRPTRWAVVDLETSGLDMQRDRILSIGAVAFDEGAVRVGDAFETVIAQTQVSDKKNIAIHGITGSAQLAGAPREQALGAFVDWLQDAPLVGWHVQFDYTFLKRAYDEMGEQPISADTLCVAQLSNVLLGRDCGDLEEVAARFCITCAQRHHAAADAWMTAQVLAVLVQLAKKEGVEGYQALRSLAKQVRWL
jgi:DNA polymerase III subunit epsilon